MKIKASNWCILYTKNTQSNKCRTLSYSEKYREVYTFDCYEDELCGVDDYGTPIAFHLVPAPIFNLLYKHFEINEGIEEGIIWTREEQSKSLDTECDEEKIDEEEPQKAILPQELVLSALNGALSQVDLHHICMRDWEYEVGDYFLPDVFIDGVHRFERGEWSVPYTEDWFTILANALYSTTCREGSKKEHLLLQLADRMEDFSYSIIHNTPGAVGYFVKEVKESSHIIENSHITPLFPCPNEGDILVYICFSHYNHDNTYHRLCIVNRRKKRFHLTYVVNPTFLEHINYTTLLPRDFDNLVSGYNSPLHNYYQDIHMDITPYIEERHYVTYEEYDRARYAADLDD